MGLTYLALGDSTTTSVNVGDNYPILVYKYIRDTYKSLKFIHKGTPGLKSSDFVTQNWFFTPFDADLVTLGVGFNDISADVAGIPAFKANITATVDKLKLINPDVKIILCTSNNGTAGVNQTYRDALVAVAQAENIYYCRFETAWDSSLNATYTSDGIHPTAAGHVLLFGVLKPIIDAIMASYSKLIIY